MGEISFTSKTNVFLFETTQREGFEAGSGGDNEADRVSFFLFCDRFRRRRSVNGRALREMEKYQATMRAEGTCSSSSAAQCRWRRSKQMCFFFSRDLAPQFQLQVISFQKPSSLATRGSGDFRVCFGEKRGEKRRRKE